jgi:hypothetical protein
MLELARGLSHLIFQTRRNCDKLVKEFAKHAHNKQILEIGSGKKVSGKYPYSCKHFFDSSNSFIQSDINPSYGHPVVDVTRMNKRNQYDIIICWLYPSFTAL